MSFLDAENIPVAEAVTFEFAGEDGVWAPRYPSDVVFVSDEPVTVAGLAAFFAGHAPDRPPPSDRYRFHLYPISSQLPAPVVRYEVRGSDVHLLWSAFSVRSREAVESVDWPLDPEVVSDRHLLFLRYADPPALMLKHEVSLARCQESVDISCYLNRDRPFAVDRVLAGGR